MKTNCATLATFKDAGLFRKYLADRCGATLTYGGLNGSYSRAVRLAAQLARLSGLSIDAVIKQARKDYAQEAR